jgi:hypothetical protein
LLSWFHPSELQTIISNLKPKSSPGYDLISSKILQELPPADIKYLAQIFNAAMLTEYFPAQLKVAKIILHFKPGQRANGPISLLPILSKVNEKLLFHRLFPIIENRRLLPDHQFGFRQRHSTIHQPHHIVHKPNEALETKQYCSEAFLAFSQAFDRVRHTGLLHKLRIFSPLKYYLILKSYLHNRHFQVKVEDSYTDLLPINAGVPQGSVLGPLLYLLYTADLPTSTESTIATFADDTANLATEPDPTIASEKLQTSLLAIQHWLTKWKLKANSSKCTCHRYHS